MLRICAALAAALLVPGIATAKELKPKFGDIDGLYYTDVAQDREACRQAVQRKIYLCGQNTGFVSNTLDRKYPGCLPIFRRQAGVCADHFRSEAYKCQGAGPARIEDFTGFACTVTATVVEEGGEPERLEPEGGTGSAAGSQDPAPKGRDSAAHLSPKCAGLGKGAKCWLEIANRASCYIFDSFYNPPETNTWSGACAGGVAVGRGTWGWQSPSNSGQATGMLVRGKPHGRWIWRYPDGLVVEGPYADGKRHGRWVSRSADGAVSEGPYANGNRHGKWVTRYPDGGLFEASYVNGKRHGSSVMRFANGRCVSERYDHGTFVKGSFKRWKC